jgi:hypothetical protein
VPGSGSDAVLFTDGGRRARENALKAKRSPTLLFIWTLDRASRSSGRNERCRHGWAGSRGARWDALKRAPTSQPFFSISLYEFLYSADILIGRTRGLRTAGG